MYKYAVKICAIDYFLFPAFMVCLTSQQEKNEFHLCISTSKIGRDGKNTPYAMTIFLAHCLACSTNNFVMVEGGTSRLTAMPISRT